MARPAGGGVNWCGVNDEECLLKIVLTRSYLAGILPDPIRFQTTKMINRNAATQ